MLMVCCFVFSLPLTTFAADSYQMNINEPAKGDNQGYILFLVQGPSGTRQVYCISWTLLPLYTDSDVTYNATEMLIDISNNSSTISFVGRSSGNYQLSAGFGRSVNGDSLRTTYWALWDNSSGVTYNYSLGSNTLLGYQVYGNGVVESHDLGSNNNVPFSVSWGNDSNYTSILTQMLAQLYIDANNDATIISQLNQLLGHAQTAEDLLISIDGRLNGIGDKLQVIKLRVQDIQHLLEEIVNAKGDSTFEEPDTSSIDDYNKSEGELVSGAEDTSDIEEEFDNFEIDADSSSLIWDIINRFVNTHPKVFGLVIGCLCLGIIALILNR